MLRSPDDGAVRQEEPGGFGPCHERIEALDVAAGHFPFEFRGQRAGKAKADRQCQQEFPDGGVFAAKLLRHVLRGCRAPAGPFPAGHATLGVVRAVNVRRREVGPPPVAVEEFPG